MDADATILLVDDDRQFARLVAERLTADGYEVHCLADPTETLQVISSLQCPLVLLDLDMPEASGLDLLRAVKSLNGAVQVIIVTGVVSMQALLLSYRWGAEFCIFKPLTSFDPLLDAVRATFHRMGHWQAAIDHLSQQQETHSTPLVPEPFPRA